MAHRSLSEVPITELIRLAREATEARRRHESEVEATARQQGEYIAELASRPGWTYVRIGEALGIDDSTAHRIARRATE